MENTRQAGPSLPAHDNPLQPKSHAASSTKWVATAFWRVAHRYWFSQERFSALAILGAIIALVVGRVYTVVTLNDLGGRFFNALQARSAAAFFHTMVLIGLFLLLQLVAIVLQSFCSQMLEIRWRRWLTDRLINDWLSDRSFYRLRFDGRLDNPDQRVSDDIRLFISYTLTLCSGLLNTILTVCAFASILWRLSGPLKFSVIGFSITPSGYMFWAALLYWLIGSLLGYAIGKPLIRLNNRQQSLEADFRFALVRIREKGEEMALYGGESQEHLRTRTIFSGVVSNFIKIVFMNTKLLAFQTFVGDGPSILPFAVAAPRYLSGALALGDLMKVGNGFGQISVALSWLVNAFPMYADWHATVDRLAEFQEDLDQIKSTKTGFNFGPSQDGAIVLDGLTVLLPNGDRLISELTLRFENGQSVLITGESGFGKSTLFRVVAGLWPFGAGTIRLPANLKSLFLPQEPYIPIGSLRAALWFPSPPKHEADEEARAALVAVNLHHLGNRLDQELHWEQSLSPGEQQRLAIAQAILYKPNWLFLDEATSALDEEQEAAAYRTLSTLLPETTIVSIGHRRALQSMHDRIIALASPGSTDKQRSSENETLDAIGASVGRSEISSGQ